jgi:hypothetical protein
MVEGSPAATTRDDAAMVRRRALRELRSARDVMGEWTDLIRQAAETRVGGVGPDEALTDRAYWDAIGLYRQLNDAISRFATGAEQIEAGEGR